MTPSVPSPLCRPHRPRTRAGAPAPPLLVLLCALVLALLGAVPAGALDPPAPAPRHGWTWPLDGAGGSAPQVARRFAAPAHRYGPGHRGVDVVGVPGARVLASGAGVVAFAGRVAGRPVVSVAHPGGLRTTYQPVLAAVRAGEPVATGAVLGTLEVAGSHCPPRACLHWGLRRGLDYLDPLALLGLGPVRLLPQGAPAARDRPGQPRWSASLPRSCRTDLVCI